MSGSMPQGEMPQIFLMTETTVAQKSQSGLDYAGMEHLQDHSFLKVMKMGRIIYRC